MQISFQHPRDEKEKIEKVCRCIQHNSDHAKDHSLVKTSSVNDRRFYKDLVADGYIERWVQPPWVHIYAKVL